MRVGGSWRVAQWMLMRWGPGRWGGLSPSGSRGRGRLRSRILDPRRAAQGRFRFAEPFIADFGVPALHGLGAVFDLVGREVEAAAVEANTGSLWCERKSVAAA